MNLPVGVSVRRQETTYVREPIVDTEEEDEVGSEAIDVHDVQKGEKRIRVRQEKAS